MDIKKINKRGRTALKATALPKRDREDLRLFEDEDVAGERIMLDTCVLIDQLQGKLPIPVEERILARTVVHSPVVMGEMSFLIGRLDRTNAGTAKAIKAIEELLEEIPDHRIQEIKPEDFAHGAILSGAASRILNFNKESRRKMTADALLAAHASRLGCLLITSNVADFDRLSQLDPRLKVAIY